MRDRLRPVLVFALAAVLQVREPAARAQTLDDPHELLAAYAAIVSKYREASAVAASELLSFGRVRLKTLDAVMGQARHNPSLLASETWTPGLLRAAAMLHSDIAFHAYSKGDHEAFHQHVEAADRVLQVAERPDPGSDFRARWHVAAGHELLASADVETARAFLTRSCELLPTEPRVRLLCGIAVTTYASRLKTTPPAIEERLIRRGFKRSRLAEDDRRQIVTRTALLEVADLHFAEALAGDPTRDESHLRIAFAHTERGKDAQAEPLLVPLAAMERPRDLVYLARLMLGAVRERQGLHEAAAALYRGASALNEEAPKARIALAQLLHGMGDRVAARQLVDRVVMMRLYPPEDPWTRFPVEFIAAPFATLAELRAEVRN
jgi:tetratricopeptide (TPR) repeat protein